jgi:hypothetical protein
MDGRLRRRRNGVAMLDLLCISILAFSLFALGVLVGSSKWGTNED